MQKNNIITDNEIYSEIIDFFINHTHNYEEAQVFILKCMDRLEKSKDEDIINDSLTLLRICLEDDVLLDSYNNIGTLTTNLSSTDKGICNFILHQELISSTVG